MARYGVYTVPSPSPTPLMAEIARHFGCQLTPEVAFAICKAAQETYTTKPSPYPIERHAPVQYEGYVIGLEFMVDVLPELEPLHQAHWLETEKYRHGLSLAPDYAAMLADERAGRLLQFTVRHAGSLVGNLRVYLNESRHTGGKVATEDTLYLSPEHRGGFLAIHLLRYAEAVLREAGCIEIRANSKTVNKADVLMRRRGFEAVATQFSKILTKG